MRTSTGSMRVMKMIQNAVFLYGNSKYTMAYAESIEMIIFPKDMQSATMSVLHRRRGMDEMFVITPLFSESHVSRRCLPGSSGMGADDKSCKVCVDTTNAMYRGNTTTRDPAMRMAWRVKFLQRNINNVLFFLCI